VANAVAERQRGDDMSSHLAPSDDDLRAIVEQVWASYLDPEGASPLLPAPPAEPSQDVSAAVSVTGAWRGHVVVACSAEASRHATGALLGVELADVTPEDITDAVGELANIIGGNVKSLLPEPSALSLPHVLINGACGWPSAVEVCQLDGVWLGEPIAVRVLESSIGQKE
jgi:chemotaxis protein CheX